VKIQVAQLTDQEIAEREIVDWPIWEKEISRFEWYYDGVEECLILEGEIDVETADGTVHITAGDFVTFPAGLSCVWDIKKPVKKHYNFR
jgi:uncharacterized protein